MMDFLKYRVPHEAEKARESLQNFKEAHHIMQVDLKIQRGELVRINRYDAESAREEWRTHRQALRQVNTEFQRNRDGYDF